MEILIAILLIIGVMSLFSLSSHNKQGNDFFNNVRSSNYKHYDPDDDDDEEDLWIYDDDD